MKFKLHKFDGGSDTVEGKDLHDALGRAGYGLKEVDAVKYVMPLGNDGEPLDTHILHDGTPLCWVDLEEIESMSDYKKVALHEISCARCVVGYQIIERHPQARAIGS